MILLEAGEGAAADEQDVGRVDLQELLLRMLAATLWRHRRDRAFHDLEQGLLHALARHVARDRRVVGLAADLVDLVDVDDAALGALDIVVGRLQQLQNDVLDVLADIAGFGERRGVGHGERHVEHARQGLGEQGLAAAGRADQHDVRLGDLDVVGLPAVAQPLVVIVHCNSENALGLVLADHIVVKDLAYLFGRRNAVLGLHQGGLALLPDDVHAKLDAFIADEYGRAGNELPDLMLALPAEAAIQGVAGVAPGFGGWHVGNAPPLGGPATCEPAHKTMLNATPGSPQPQNVVCRLANRDQLVATAP